MSSLTIIQYSSWYDTDGQDEATSASDTATYTLENDAASEFWDFWIGTHITASQATGSYESPVHNISKVGISGGSKITWDLALQNATLAVDSRLSADGGSTYSEWETCSNGQTVPGIIDGTDLSASRLQYRLTLMATIQTAVVVAKASGSVTLLVQEQVTISALGTFEAYPTITMTFSAAGTLAKIERESGGPYIEVTSASLSAGSVLEFDLANMTITKGSTNMLAYMTSGSSSWALQPDTSYSPIITTDANATIILSHTPRWL